ncbi:MAG: hypothetical protein HYX72_09305 [Acidobacteria bacterium]|nr:hypothetical protein [Acidobacteriota bacterium]
MRDWFSDKRYLALLVLIAVLILVVGSWLRPRRQTAQLVVSEADRLRLQLLALQKNVHDFTSYFEQVAVKLSVHLVRVNEASLTGLVWENGNIIVPGLPRSHPADFTLRADNYEFRATPAAVVPRLAISVLEAGKSLKLPAAAGPKRGIPDPGTWVLLMTRQEDGSIGYSPGFFSSMSTAQCGDETVKEVVSSVPLDPSMLGGGLFDLDGHFLGMILPCGRRLAVVSVASLNSWLQAAKRPAGRLLLNYGIRLSDLDSRTSAHFRRYEGVLVSEVWKGSPAETAGLVPGDILVSWGAMPVRKMEDLIPLLPNFADGAANIELLRGRRVLKKTLEGVAGGWWSRAKPITNLGLQIETPVAGFRIESAEPASRAYSRGLRAGDRVETINGKTVSRQQASRTLKMATAENPIYIVISREDKTVGVLLP